MLALIASILAQAEEGAEEVSEAKDLYPALGELLVGLFAFAVLFFFTWKWVIPRFKQVLEERKDKIQGEMERAESTRTQADELLEEYRTQLAGARDDANRSSRKPGRPRTSSAATSRRGPRRSRRRSWLARRRRSGPSATARSRSSAPRSVRSRWRSRDASWGSPSTNGRTSG